MNLYFIFIVVFLQVFTKVYGQPGSPISLSLNYLPAKNGNQSALFNAHVSVNIPVYKDSTITGLIGNSLKYYSFNFQNDSLNIRNLYSWSVPFTFLFRTSANKYFTLLMEPMLSSDFKDISVSDFRYNVAFFFLNRTSQNSSYGVGLAISKRFSGFQIAPLWFVNLRFCKNWLISGTIPFKTKIAYAIDSKRQVGIGLGASNNSFRLSEIDNNRYVDYQAIEASVFYQQLILKHFKFNINMGAQSIQKEVYNRNQTSPLSIFLLNRNKSSNPVESIKNKGMLLQVGISYSPF